MAEPEMKKILLIDDDEMTHMLVKASLKDVLCDGALSGEEGIRMASDTLYDLILIDYIMPEKDGFDTFEELGYGINSGTPCILMSANEGSEFEYEVRQAGFFDFIKKPVVRSELMALCDRLRAGEIGACGSMAAGEDATATEVKEETDANDSTSAFLDKALGLSFCEDEMIYKTYCETFLSEWTVKKE